MTQNNVPPNSHSAASTPIVATSKGRGGRSRTRVLSVLLTIVVVCAVGLAWWRPWDADDTPPPPVTVCDGVYETAELDRILGSQIGDYWTVHLGPASQCTVQSGKPAATNARGYELGDTIALIKIPVDYEEYDAGNGVKWTEESMAAAADTGQDVQKLDTPDLEGSSYVWVRQIESDNDVYGFWFGDGYLVVLILGDPENKLDGPQTTQEALDIMPELLTYIGTQAQKHDILPTPTPTPTPSETPTTEPADASNQATDVDPPRSTTADVDT